MEITEVVVRPVEDERLRAYVSLTIENALVIKDIKIVEGKNGLFVSMPSRRRKNGKYQDIAHPINSEFRRMLEDHVFREYKKIVGTDFLIERQIPAVHEAMYGEA
ncbi:MAG: septation regulator SpoVG [Nitrospinae bacterium]|nr:septation regulator SpoVG [Nitrospinota bacterium]